jgi:hypothetical protein
VSFPRTPPECFRGIPDILLRTGSKISLKNPEKPPAVLT